MTGKAFLEYNRISLDYQWKIFLRFLEAFGNHCSHPLRTTNPLYEVRRWINEGCFGGCNALGLYLIYLIKISGKDWLTPLLRVITAITRAAMLSIRYYSCAILLSNCISGKIYCTLQ